MVKWVNENNKNDVRDEDPDTGGFYPLFEPKELTFDAVEVTNSEHFFMCDEPFVEVFILDNTDVCWDNMYQDSLTVVPAFLDVDSNGDVVDHPMENTWSIKASKHTLEEVVDTLKSLGFEYVDHDLVDNYDGDCRRI